MILIIWIFATAFAIYLMQRSAVRSEKQHERNKERFEQLLGQIKKSKSKTDFDSEEGETN